MKEGTRIFTVFGIDVKLHYSWWFIFILLSWSLSSTFFPFNFPGYTVLTYWLMGIIASLLLFISVLLHELSHSLVARLKKIKVQSITLFFFGGVAGIDSEEMKPSSEFMMAIAGPLFSLILAGTFYLIYQSDGNSIVTAITFYLYQLNLILAVFNLVPGYPLDGGRAFRAVLHAYYKDLTKATAIASQVGKLFAGFLIVTGIVGVFLGLGSLWFVLIGIFLYFLAGMSYQQVVAKEILEKLKVKEIMRKKLITIPPGMKFSDFIKKYANHEDNVFLVKDRTFTGLLDADQIKPLVSEAQKTVSVKQVAVPLKSLLSVSANDSAYKAFKLLTGCKAELIPVVDKNSANKSSLAGIVTQRSLLNRLAWEIKFKVGSKKIRDSRIKH